MDSKYVGQPTENRNDAILVPLREKLEIYIT